MDLDTNALLAKGLTPNDVVNAVNTQNLVLPSGTAKIGATEYVLATNGSPDTIAGLNSIPVVTRNGATTYLSEVAHVRDGFSPQTNIVRQNGQRGVLVSIIKNGGSSTLDIVSALLAQLPLVAQILPKDLKITPLFDQSGFVRAAISGVVREALIAACLTAALILLFLGNWRSTCIIAVSIPLSILTSIIALYVMGETLNIMTLGGLALAVGILVDDATVTIENIERHLHLGSDLHKAILEGAGEIAVPGPGLHSVHLHRFRAHVLSHRRGALFVRAAGDGRGVRDAGLLCAVAHAGAHAGDAADGSCAGGGRSRAAACCSACTAPSTRASRRFAAAIRSFSRRCSRTAACSRASSWAFACCRAAWCSFWAATSSPAWTAARFACTCACRPGTRIEETARVADEVEGVIRTIVPAARSRHRARQSRRAGQRHQQFLQQRRNLRHPGRRDSDLAQRGTPADASTMWN